MNTIYYETPVTILIADHDEDNRCLLKAVLTLKGFHVIEALNGEDAFNLAVEKQPSLVVIDLKLPRVNGFRVIRKLRHAGLLNTPIIAISLSVPTSHRSTALAAGCVAHIEKPVEPDLFDELLDQFLPGQRADLITALVH